MPGRRDRTVLGPRRTSRRRKCFVYLAGYNSATTARQLRDVLERQPFQPCRVRLSSGDAYKIRDPDLAVVMRSCLFLAFPNSDHWTLIPFLHIATVESLANGDTRKNRRHR